MRSQLAMITTAALMGAVAASSAAPAVASANSLLSGYGGPGQGSQVILGATLLNSPPGGGEGGAGSTPAGGSAGAGGQAAGATSGRAGSAGAGSANTSGHGSSRASGGGQAATDRSAGSARASSATPAATSRSSLQPSVGSQPLGLSGDDLLYLFVAVGALVVTAALTKQLARRSG
ncbi:MAG TPA: hypothetical protein VK778_07840 [Solirubrobacteraceae bacterium]|jgi:hypothetical protein|nr:hypothetical protein [Solirubrobacteraceae bacterium]